MDLMQGLVGGFTVALTPENLLYAFLGVFLGTVIGVMPGIGPTAGMGILLPVTYSLPPVSAMIMLAGVFYGAQYGGSTTSILLNLPGEATSVITAIDGNMMAKQGRAGKALGIAAIGSFIAGTISVVGLMVVAPALVVVALSFGPHEYFSLMVLGLTMLTYLTGASASKALAMGAFGLLLGTVGADPMTGARRFTFGQAELIEGVSFIPVVMGLFALSEIFYNERHGVKGEVVTNRIRDLWPSPQDLRDSIGAILRGTGIGFVLGVLPGAGVLISTFLSYTVERRLSKTPERFGQGAIQGVAGPESANNAASGAALVPLLALGIPSSAVTAIMLGALILHGMRPGPLLMSQHPELFWGLVASMYIGNVMLLILNLPLVGLFASILRIPYRYLWPLIMLFTLVGVYSTDNSAFDLLVLVAFGLIGWILREADYPMPPIVLGLVLGPMMEQALRQALIASRGDFADFVTRPLSAVLLLAAALVAFSPLVTCLLKRSRPEALALGSKD